MNLNDIHRSVLILCILVFFSPSICNTPAQAEPPAKQVALTFDDGPYGAPTIEILNILKSENINATFFVIGENVKKYPEIAKEIVADGNVIGNHSYDHPRNIDTFPTKEFNEELSTTEEAIFSATNLRPSLFRAPYGKTNPQMLTELKNDNYTLVKWNVDSEDWNYSKSPTDVVEKNVLGQVKPNMIILFHDGRDTHINYPRDNTIKALPNIIDTLKQQGYSFMTVDKLLGISAYK